MFGCLYEMIWIVVKHHLQERRREEARASLSPSPRKKRQRTTRHPSHPRCPCRRFPRSLLLLLPPLLLSPLIRIHPYLSSRREEEVRVPPSPSPRKRRRRSVRLSSPSHRRRRRSPRSPYSPPPSSPTPLATPSTPSSQMCALLFVPPWFDCCVYFVLTTAVRDRYQPVIVAGTIAAGVTYRLRLTRPMGLFHCRPSAIWHVREGENRMWPSP